MLICTICQTVNVVQIRHDVVVRLDSLNMNVIPDRHHVSVRLGLNINNITKPGGYGYKSRYHDVSTARGEHTVFRKRRSGCEFIRLNKGI